MGIDKNISEKLRKLLSEKCKGRSKFRLLEEASSISADKWRNFFYNKQHATEEMLAFWCKTHPEDQVWLSMEVAAAKRTIIQIQTSHSAKPEGFTELIALCNDGSVWTRSIQKGAWVRVDDVPQD